MSHSTIPPNLLNALMTPATRQLFIAFGEDDLRFVGGCIRNIVMGYKVGDIDFATPLPPENVIKRLHTAGIRVVPTGIDHGTVTAVIDGTGYEITTLRRDVETDGRHAVVSYTTDWAVDAARRDFTVNALYADKKGQIYDPLGTGLADCQKNLIRFIGTPADRIQEDALRILRFLRFTCYYGHNKIDEDGWNACLHFRHLLSALSRERITKEIFHILEHGACAETLLLISENQLLPDDFPEIINTERIVSLIEYQELAPFTDRDTLLASRMAAITPSHVFSHKTLNNKLIINKKMKSAGSAICHEIIDTQRIDISKMRLLLYRYPRQTVHEILNHFAARDHLSLSEFTPLLTTCQDESPPLFPLNGHDFIARGYHGAALGALQKEIEARWIESEFRLSRKELLQLVPNISLKA